MKTKVYLTGIIGRDSTCSVYHNGMAEYRFILMHGEGQECLVCEMWLDQYDPQWLKKLIKDREVAVVGYMKYLSNRDMHYLEATEITIIRRGRYDIY